VDYESKWQSWWLEFTDDGSFIHLEGLNLCAAYYNLPDCENTGGDEFYWSSICGENPTGEGIPSNGEGILMVMGSPTLLRPLNDMHLRPMSLQEVPWSYEAAKP